MRKRITFTVDAEVSNDDEEGESMLDEFVEEIRLAISNFGFAEMSNGFVKKKMNVTVKNIGRRK